MNEDLVKKILDSLTPEQRDELVNKVLNSNVKVDEPPKKEKPRQSVEDADFLSPIIQDSNIETRKGGTPGNEVGDRSNSFTDNGEEAKDITTPDFKPTERKRNPYKPIQQKCQRCDKVIEVNPVHKREFFVCDRCLVK